jgi:adenosylcobinamide-phosphate guanylyltransferase
MCGGEGSRLREGGVTTEKPLVEVGEQPMIDRICAALADSQVETVYVAVSPAAPATREHVRDLDVSVIETPGEGYVADLDHALESVGRPALTVAADLPLLTPGLVDRVLTVADDVGEDRSVTVCVPTDLKRRLGVSTDTTIPPAADDDTTVLTGVPSEAKLAGDESSVGTRELAPAGINVVADPGDAGESDSENVTLVSHDLRFAVNVNRTPDLAIAEALCD